MDRQPWILPLGCETPHQKTRHGMSKRCQVAMHKNNGSYELEANCSKIYLSLLKSCAETGKQVINIPAL